MKLCRFGQEVISTIEYWVDGDNISVGDPWKLYNEIELIFRHDGWIDSGEADDLRSEIANLENKLEEE